MSDWADLETGLQTLRGDAEIIAQREFGTGAREAYQRIERTPVRARDIHAQRLAQLHAALEPEGRW